MRTKAPAPLSAPDSPSSPTGKSTKLVTPRNARAPRSPRTPRRRSGGESDVGSRSPRRRLKKTKGAKGTGTRKESEGADACLEIPVPAVDTTPDRPAKPPSPVTGGAREPTWRECMSTGLVSVMGSVMSVDDEDAGSDEDPDDWDTEDSVLEVVAQLKEQLRTAFNRIARAVSDAIADVLQLLTGRQSDEVCVEHVATRLKACVGDDFPMAARLTYREFASSVQRLQKGIEDTVRVRMRRAVLLGGGKGGMGGLLAKQGGQPRLLGIATQIITKGYSERITQASQTEVETRTEGVQTDPPPPPSPPPSPVKEAEPEERPESESSGRPPLNALSMKFDKPESGLVDWRRRGEPQMRALFLSMHPILLRLLAAVFRRLSLRGAAVGDLLAQEQQRAEAMATTIRGDRATDYVQMARILVTDTKLCDLVTNWLEVDRSIISQQLSLALRGVRLRLSQRRMERMSAPILESDDCPNAARQIRAGLRRFSVNIGRCHAVRQELLAKRQQMYAGFCFRLKQVSAGAPEVAPSVSPFRRRNRGGGITAATDALSELFAAATTACAPSGLTPPVTERGELSPVRANPASPVIPTSPTTVFARTVHVRRTEETYRTSASPAESSPVKRSAGGAVCGSGSPQHKDAKRWAPVSDRRQRSAKTAGVAVGGAAVHGVRGRSTRFQVWTTK